MSTASNRDQFLKQLEAISDGIKQNLSRIDKKKIEKKAFLDNLNDTFTDLIVKKRVYYKTLKDFQEECKKNELLLAKIQS